MSISALLSRRIASSCSATPISVSVPPGARLIQPCQELDHRHGVAALRRAVHRPARPHSCAPWAIGRGRRPKPDRRPPHPAPASLHRVPTPWPPEPDPVSRARACSNSPIGVMVVSGPGIETVKFRRINKQRHAAVIMQDRKSLHDRYAAVYRCRECSAATRLNRAGSAPPAVCPARRNSAASRVALVGGTFTGKFKRMIDDLARRGGRAFRPDCINQIVAGNQRNPFRAQHLFQLFPPRAPYPATRQTRLSCRLSAARPARHPASLRASQPACRRSHQPARAPEPGTGHRTKTPASSQITAQNPAEPVNPVMPGQPRIAKALHIRPDTHPHAAR